MKKAFAKLAMCMTLFCNVLGFTSCTEKENEIHTGGNLTKSSPMTRSEMREVSKEIADFHDLEIRLFYYYRDLSNISITTKSDVSKLAEMIYADIANYRFNNINSAWFPHEMSPLFVNGAYKIGVEHELSFENLISAEDAMKAGISISKLQNISFEVDKILEDAFNYSEDIDAFTSMYFHNSDSILNVISGDMDYFISQIYVDMLYSTFCTWTEIYYSNDGTKGLPSLRDAYRKAKQVVKKVWDEMPVEVKADVAGAAAGAAVGAAAGAAGLAAGVAAGAAVGGVSEGITSSVVTHVTK